jgi:hypothetical protein
METSIIPALNPQIVSIAEAAPAPYVLPDLPATLSLRPVRIIENLNPFHVEERRVIEIAPLDNESAAALVTRAEIHLDDYKCSRNGSLIPDEELWSTAVEPGDELVLFPRAAGGRVWEMISMVALLTLVACFTGVGVGFAGFAAMMGMSGTAAGLIGAAALMGGSMLISWAFSPGQPSSPSWSSTYDPTGPKGLAQPGVPVPKAYGTMGWCGNVISSYVNFDGTDAYINCLVCYGWGQAKNISNVLINQQPISVFSNCSYQVRLGTNNQPPIDGFDRTTNGYPQEIEMLISNGSIVVQGTGTNVQGLDITVKFPSGLYRITGDGNDVPLKVIYKIEVSPHNANTWTSPLFPNNTQTVATTHSDGSQTWPKWVVVPTDRFAGSGIVYASDNGTHTPGDLWSNTETVSTINVNGSTSNTSATFKGEWQPCDPNLNQALVTNWWQGYRVVENCTFSAFFDTVSVYGLTAGQWDVRITKTAWEWDNNHYIFYSDATSSQTVCDCWLWNINEIFWSNLSYPNMILVGVKALATSQLNGGSIQLMATITHDIGADTVIPAQLSAYGHDNPAIVAYDMLTNPLYGMGIAANMIDVPAFVAWAAFNDQIVTNQDGSQTRRHIFSGTFDQAGDAWHALGIIGGMSRASIIQLGMRYSVILDAPGDPVQLFTVGNTKKDSFTEAWVALDDRCTLIEVDFADAARNYRMDLPVSVMTAADINSGLQPKITRTKLTGCTSRDQAWRWAYFHLMSTKLTLRTIQFSAPVQAGSTLNTLSVDRTDLTFATAAGWTVSVQHPVVQRGTVQVQSVSGINVTMTAALPAGRIVKAVVASGTEYIVTGYSGSTITLAGSTGSLAAGSVLTLYDANVIDNMSVVSVAITPGLGAVVSISGQFSAVPSKDSAWAYGQSAGAQPAKLFRVVSIKKSGDFAFDIGALEYNPIIYTDVVPNYGEIVGVPDSSPVITDLTLAEQFQNGTLTGSSNSAVVSVGWRNNNTAVGAQVQVQASGGTWNTLGNIQGQSCTFTGTIGTTYNVSATGFDWQGNLLGSPVTGLITVQASTNVPANVTGFSCAINASGLPVLTWAAVTGADHYEIRYADSQAYYPWDTAAVLWDGTGTTWTDTTLRTGMYMIVAVLSVAAGGLQSLIPAYITPYPDPPIVTLSQSATNTSGSGASSTASAGVTVNSNGSVTTAGIVWLTISWTWPTNYPTPSAFNVVAFTGSDPTAAANYLFDMVTVGATTKSYTVAVCPTAAMSVVNAAVRSVYA